MLNKVSHIYILNKKMTQMTRIDNFTKKILT